MSPAEHQPHNVVSRHLGQLLGENILQLEQMRQVAVSAIVANHFKVQDSVILLLQPPKAIKENITVDNQEN